ncbi:MAG: amidohydrolase family protein [Burkholderiales bacterium]
MPTRILDIHPHVITTDTVRYPRDPLGGTQSGWSRDRPVTYDQMVAAMDEAGVAKAAIVQASTCYGYDNGYVADAIAAHPNRFSGVFSVDLLAADAPAKIRYWVGRKLVGLRLFTTGSTMPGQATWMDDPRTFPAWECAAELNIPVCMQMRQEGLPQLNGLIARYPKVRFIIDHLMRPDLEAGPPYAAAAGLFSLAGHRNVYLKLTSNSVIDAKKGKATPETFFGKLVGAFGASRIAWGSNFPATEGSLKQILDTSKAALAFLPDEDQEWIFWRTAESLYPALKG